MKRIYVSSTKWFFFLTELPLLVVLAAAVYFNAGMTTTLKLYPLIVVFGALVIFDLLFFFRIVRFSYEDIRTMGRFSSRDKVFLAKDKVLLITRLPHRRLRIEVIGQDDDSPALSFLSTKDSLPFCQLRCKAVGGRRTVLRLLAFYRFAGADIPDTVWHTDDTWSATSDTGTLTVSTVNACREFRLTFAHSFDADGTIIEDDVPEVADTTSASGDMPDSPSEM